MSEDSARRVTAPGRHLRTLLICSFAVGNYALFYAVGIVLARDLGPTEFGDYSVAVTAVTMLATLATLGLEKYALRSLTSYLGKRDLSAARGFLQFSGVVVVALGVALAALSLLALGLYEALTPVLDREDHAFRSLILFLPIIALALQLVELATAADAPLRATAVYRLLFPLTVLVLVLLLGSAPTFDARTAAIAYGAAWIVALVALAALAWRKLPRAIWSAKAAYRPGRWIGRSLAFMTNSLLLSLIGGSGILMLEFVGRTEAEVGVFGAVGQTAALVILVSTSTSRFYLPQISVLIDRADEAGVRQVLRGRRILVGSICALFLLVVIFAGRRLLGMFSEEFESGYGALVVMSVGTAINTFFGLAPYLLQFMDASRIVVIVMSATAVANVALAALLGALLGPLGVAIAATAASSAGFLVLHTMTARRLAGLSQRTIRPE